MDKIKSILNSFEVEDYDTWMNTVDELCKNGIGKGCYQDYQMLMIMIDLLYKFGELIKNKE